VCRPGADNYIHHECPGPALATLGDRKADTDDDEESAMIAGALRSAKRDREDSTMLNTLDARRGRSRARSERKRRWATARGARKERAMKDVKEFAHRRRECSALDCDTRRKK